MTEPGAHQVTSEVERLRTVLLHRPGAELQRLTPRNNADLLFDGLPWVSRAQEEHDGFAAALRARDVEVLYLTDLLVTTLESPEARTEVVDSAVAPTVVGPRLATVLRAWLLDQSSEALAGVLAAGLTHEELPSHGADGVVARLSGQGEFVVRPLPNLLFTRDSSVWVGDHVAVTSPSMHARQRERALTGAIYRHHPRFLAESPDVAGTGPIIFGEDRPGTAGVEGGDLLAIAPDGSLVLIELKRDKTPREIVAQSLDYASWVEGLAAEKIAQIYERFSNSGSFTVKKYHSAKSVTEEGWKHEQIALLPLNPDYDPIIVSSHEGPEMVVVGEWVSTID